MERLESSQVEQILEHSKEFSIPSFEKYISKIIERSANASMALEELDVKLALLQNQIQLLSLYIKQNYLIPKTKDHAEVEYYTKQELANKFRVSIRTVTNWIIDGLEAEDVGGVKRISSRALDIFKRTRSGRKIHWKSAFKKF